jgi:predicted flap endonuclease-1-like 5' DNA nuclease
LLRIVGIGPKIAGDLHEMGITRFEQIAKWSQEDVGQIEQKLEFPGRVHREEWIRQAHLLSEGNELEFDREFGRGRAGKVLAREAAEEDNAHVADRKTDDLSIIRFIKPAEVKLLNSLGTRRYRQISHWTADDVTRVEKSLGTTGRVASEVWIRQAELLADGDMVEFTKLYQVEKSRTQAKQTTKKAKPKGSSGPRGGKRDNLQRLNGVGPKYEKILNGLGFYHFDQIAGWTKEQVEWVDDHLNFNGRIEREEWVRQSKLLAKGNEEQFLRDYGTGGMKDKSGTTQAGSRTKRN